LRSGYKPLSVRFDFSLLTAAPPPQNRSGGNTMSRLNACHSAGASPTSLRNKVHPAHSIQSNFDGSV
jgi:hypothetical protein